MKIINVHPYQDDPTRALCVTHDLTKKEAGILRKIFTERGDHENLRNYNLGKLNNRHTGFALNSMGDVLDERDLWDLLTPDQLAVLRVCVAMEKAGKFQEFHALAFPALKSLPASQQPSGARVASESTSLDNAGPA